MKKTRKLLWEMLFMYLAISKVIYWYHIIVNVDGFDGVGAAIMNRLLGQDLMVVMSVVIIFFMEKTIEKKISSKKSKYGRTLNNIMMIISGYVVVTAIFLVYLSILNLIFTGNVFILGGSLRSAMLNWTAMYLAIAIVLTVKDYLKAKEKKTSDYTTSSSVEDKLKMLKTLLDDNVLTKEEYEAKESEIVQQSK